MPDTSEADEEIQRLRAELDATTQAGIANLAEVYRLRSLADPIIDLCWKATPYGQTEDGDVYSYILPKGVVHRLIGVAQSAGISAAFRNSPRLKEGDYA